MSLKYNAWTFTLHNPDEGSIQRPIFAQFFYYGHALKETEEGGCLYLQGFVIFDHRTTRKNVKKDLVSDALHTFYTDVHIEPKNFTNAQACSFFQDIGEHYYFLECGQVPPMQDFKGQTQEEVYRHAFHMARQGRFDAIDRSIYTRYKGTFHEMRMSDPSLKKIEDLQGELKNLWLYDPSGSHGSTQTIQTLYYPSLFVKSHDKWWDGYTDEEVVLIKDFTPNCMDTLLVKKLGHHHAFWAEDNRGIKNRRLIRPKKTVIISRYCIDACFTDVHARAGMKWRYKEINTSDPLWLQHVTSTDA